MIAFLLEFPGIKFAPFLSNMTVVVGVSTLATFMVLQILVPPVRVDPGDRVAFAAAEGATG